MKILSKLLILIMIFSGFSCSSLIMTMAGMKTPEIETKESIYQFLIKIHQDTSDVFCLDTNLLRHLQSQPFKPGWAPGFKPVQIRVYDHTGEPVMQWASCEGSLNKLRTFDSVPPVNTNALDKSLTLKSDMERYFDFNGNPVHISDDKNYDYFILVCFAKYFARLSKTSFRKVHRYISDHPELKIKLYKINVDFQKSWNAEIKTETVVRVGGSK